MKISIRKKRVRTKLIEKSLLKTEEDVYNPKWAYGMRVRLTFGFTKDKSPDAPYGFMTYHKNRLIKAYEKIGIQKATGEGYGIIGVAEVNFLEPIHNKQDFRPTGQYFAFMNNAAKKMRDYYKEKTHTESSITEAVLQPEESWNWVQCDNCMRFRRMPGDFDMDKLPEKWYCKNNPDPLFNRCEISEEFEGEDEERVQPKPTSILTVQKKKAMKRRLEKLKEEAVLGFQASQGGGCYKSIAGNQFEPSDYTEVYPGKREYPDTDGSDDRITRPRTRESENHLVTTLSFGGFNLERCPTKRNSHKKTFTSPRSSRKTSPRTVSKRSVESTRDISYDELSDIDIEKKIINLYTEKKADPDKKPDEEELEKILTEMDQVLSETLPDETDKKKVFQHKASQTVPTVVKFACPNEVKLLKLCPTEQRQALLLKTRELDELRRNILTFMKILGYEYKYGPPENVDKVIKVLIKANNEQKNAS